MNTLLEETIIDRRKAIITAVVLLALFCSFLYLTSLGPDGKRAPRKPTQAVHFNAPDTASPPEPTSTIALLEIATATPPFVQLQSGASFLPAAGSIWKFLRFDPKDLGLFESLDAPGTIIKARCQQPDLPAPQPGTLYRLDAAGILTPVSGDMGIQSFLVVK